MTPEEYAASQYLITAGLAAYVKRVATFWAVPKLGVRDWLDFLRAIFPEVQKKYEQSAGLGRTFYDAQRKRHHPDLVRNDRFLSELKFEWFAKNMESVRKGMSQADSPAVAASNAAMAAVREVEMAGRRQILGAVKDDPDLEDKIDTLSSQEETLFGGSGSGETRPVIGWARVATGRETCAWCLMLISRGAEVNHKGNFAYSEAMTAGLNLDDETAIDLFLEAGSDPERFIKNLREDSKDNVEQWHVGCDCVAVPVFDLADWPGKSQAVAALQLWIDASKEAAALIKSGKARTDDKSVETLNALRRRLYRGEINMSSYAAAA